MNYQASKATRAVRASIESDTQYGAVVPPLHLSSNFSFKGFGEKREYDYTRSGNPTRDALADALTDAMLWPMRSLISKAVRVLL